MAKHKGEIDIESFRAQHESASSAEALKAPPGGEESATPHVKVFDGRSGAGAAGGDHEIEYDVVAGKAPEPPGGGSASDDLMDPQSAERHIKEGVITVRKAGGKGEGAYSEESEGAAPQDLKAPPTADAEGFRGGVFVAAGDVDGSAEAENKLFVGGLSFDSDSAHDEQEMGAHAGGGGGGAGKVQMRDFSFSEEPTSAAQIDGFLKVPDIPGESQDSNFEVQDLMSRYNQSEQLAANVAHPTVGKFAQTDYNFSLADDGPTSMVDLEPSSAASEEGYLQIKFEEALVLSVSVADATNGELGDIEHDDDWTIDV